MSYRQIARVLGNLATYPVGARTVERVAIPSDALARRVLRLASAVGDLGVRLDDDARVRAGDVLYADENRVIAVDVLPEPVLIVRPGSLREAIAVAHALGNRHIPIQHEGDSLVVAEAPALAELFHELGVPFARTERVLSTPFRHAAAPHVH